MLRQPNNRYLGWEGKTFTTLRENALISAHDTLIQHFADTHLFTSHMDDESLRSLWQASYYPLEDEPLPSSQKKLCQMILAGVPAECCMLSHDESFLVVEALEHGFVMLSQQPPQMLAAALSLCKRLWCSLTAHDDEIILSFYPNVLRLLELTVNGPNYEEAHHAAFSAEATINVMLYAGGTLDTHIAVSMLINDLDLNTRFFCTPRSIHRFLMASFDEVMLPSGRLMLIHPGAADADDLLGTAFHEGDSLNQLQPSIPQAMCILSTGMLPDELNSTELLCTAIANSLRSQFEPHEVAADLRLMLKQGAPMDAVMSVLSNRLAVLPTDHMTHCVQRICDTTLPWKITRKAALN